jgi:hypothetical protein
VYVPEEEEEGGYIYLYIYIYIYIYIYVYLDIYLRRRRRKGASRPWPSRGGSGCASTRHAAGGPEQRKPERGRGTEGKGVRWPVIFFKGDYLGREPLRY